jgi:hypothetical protein
MQLSLSLLWQQSLQGLTELPAAALHENTVIAKTSDNIIMPILDAHVCLTVVFLYFII